jgi:RNA polymerase sigma factor (sigma-70 family)
MVLELQSASREDDIERLYRRLAERLAQIVRRDVHAPEPLIEDACQAAWGRLVDHSARVRRDTALAWLATTAVHEAFRLLRRDRRELSLEETLETAGEARISQRCPGAAEVAEQRERIGELGRLPARQQRLVWLKAFGLSYAEIAAYEGCTTRTVERQLLRAKQALREGVT